MNIRKSKSWNLPESAATPEIDYLNRRKFLKAVGLGSSALIGSSIAQAATAGFPSVKNDDYLLEELEPTDFELIAGYNNFYEFSYDKGEVQKLANQGWKTEPWTIELAGHCDNPMKVDVNDLIKKIGGIEQRVYRFRCVEAWSMVIPWDGFELSALINLAQPNSKAKYLKFTTFYDPESAPGLVADPSRLGFEERDFLADTLKPGLALIYVYAEAPWRSNEAAETVVRLREVSSGDLDVRVGGPTAENLDGRLALSANMPTVFWIIVATNVAILFLAFGSIVLPFKAIAMNVVSVVASFGALVWIFQDGNLQGLLHFEPQSGIEVTVPVILLAVVFGLSMDYEIFMLSRIKEEFDRSGDNTSSVATGLEHTSSIITRAALLLIAVVAAFAFGDFIFVKEIGVGLVVAIFLDATIVRCVLVPSTMKLLGRFNWWSPAWLRRIWDPKFEGL